MKTEEKIRFLSLLMDKIGISELEIKNGGFECKLKKRGGPPSPIRQEEKKEFYPIRSSTVGIFYPKVKKGENVRKGESIGTVMVIGEPYDVIADRDGEVHKVLIKEGEAVQYGQELILVK
jgi:acetyl/propionyl-CoA carboxylase alpha subunit